jgi:hypothetical protein
MFRISVSSCYFVPYSDTPQLSIDCTLLVSSVDIEILEGWNDFYELESCCLYKLDLKPWKSWKNL